MSRFSADTARRSVRHLAPLWVSLSLVVVGASGAMAQDADVPTDPLRTISVSATGHAEVEPDEAVLRFGVTARAATADAATRRSATAMASVIEALEGAGIDPSDIRTTRLDLHERRQRDPDTGERTTSWQVQNQVRVTVGDLDRLGQIMDTAIGAGATNVGGLYFRATDAAAATSEARLEAVAAAEATAAELADAAGVSVVGLVSLVEGDVGDVVSLAVPEARALRAADTAATPIEPGTLDVNVTVHVVFEVG